MGCQYNFDPSKKSECKSNFHQSNLRRLKIWILLVLFECRPSIEVEIHAKNLATHPMAGKNFSKEEKKVINACQANVFSWVNCVLCM